MFHKNLARFSERSGFSLQTSHTPTVFSSIYSKFLNNIFSIILFIVLATFRFTAALPVNRNADDANNLLAGADMVRGNWNLHGWTMAPDNYVPTDVLAQGLISLLFGLRPVSMGLVEAMIWSAITVVGIRLAKHNLVGSSRFIAAVTVIALILFSCRYDRPGYEFMTGVGSHGFTLLLALLAFGLATTVRNGRHQRHIWALGGVVLTGSFADPIFLTVAALPIVVSCMLAFRCEPGAGRVNREMLTMGGITLAAVVASRVLLALNAETGGFQSVELTIRFASFKDTLAHLAFAANGMIALFGADFFEHVLTNIHLINQVVFLLRFPFVLALIIVLILGGVEMVFTLRDWPYGRETIKTARPDTVTLSTDRAADDVFLDQLLWISVLCCISESVITTVITDTTAIRFFLPATVTGAILIARQLSAIPIFSLYAATAATTSIVLGLLALLHGSARPARALNEDRQLAQFLQDRGLQHGYSGYWSGGLLTVLTHGKVECLALVDDGSGPLHSLNWFTNLDWYKAAASTWHGKVFFIAADHPASPIDLSQQRIRQLFGNPGEVVSIGTLQVDIYDTTVSPLPGLARREHRGEVT